MGYSVYPNAIDTSTQLPITTDLVTLVTAQVVNRLRDAILAIETELGVNPSDTYSTVKDRLNFLSSVFSTSAIASAVLPCDSSVNVGDFVYVDGYTVYLADASNITTAPAIGNVISKSSTTSAVITFFGVLTLTGLTPGKEYFLDISPGEISITPPSASGNVIQSLGFSISDLQFLFLPNLNYIII